MNAWFVGGKSIDSVEVDDRGFQYGDGLFETIAIRDGSPRFWNSHFERLCVGCDRLAISQPHDATLQEELMTAIANSGVNVAHATAKIIVTAGSGPRGYQRQAVPQVVTRIGIFRSAPLAPDAYHHGVATRLCQTRLAIQPQLAGIKSLHRLEQVLARAEWNDTAIMEGLMLDTEGRLICGTMSNVFICTEKSFATPAITRCGISGVMRRHVIAMLKHDGIDCDVRDIHRDEIYAADKLFLANSQFGILPVRRLEDVRFTVDSMSKKLLRLAARNGVAEGSM